MKIAITTSSFAKFSNKPLEMLAERNIEAVLNPYGRALTEDETISLLQGCAGVAAGTEPLNAKVIEALPELKVISRCGTGMDNVDMQAAKAKGIAVRNTPDAPTKAVAELTLGYALDLLRKISLMDRELRSGIWKKHMGNLLSGKELGVIGFGRIGRAVGELFQLMGCRVSFYDPFCTSEQGEGYQRLDIQALVRNSDILTLHCAKPKDGKPVLDSTLINAMKPGALLINAARGGLVDEDALCGALRSGALGGAALDVYGKEPYTGPLVALESVVLTPHIGSYAKESRIQMEVETITNLLDALDGLEAQ